MPSYTRKRRERNVSLAIDCRVSASDLPYGRRTTERRVENPYEQGRSVVVTASLRGDPLARLFARKQIDECQYEAGRYVQGLFEATSLGSVHSIDPLQEAVDGGGGGTGEPITDRHLKAGKALQRARLTLGARSYELMRAVLSERQFIEQIAGNSGLVGNIAIRSLSRRFQDCLDELAVLFGFAGESRPSRAQRDKYSEQAKRAAA